MSALDELIDDAIEFNLTDTEPARAELAQLRADVARLTQERDDWKLNAQVAHMERDVAQARVAELEGYIDRHNERVLLEECHKRL